MVFFLKKFSQSKLSKSSPRKSDQTIKTELRTTQQISTQTRTQNEDVSKLLGESDIPKFTEID